MKIAFTVIVSISAIVKISQAAEQTSGNRTKTTVVKAQPRKPSVKVAAVDNQELTLDSEADVVSATSLKSQTENRSGDLSANSSSQSTKANMSEASQAQVEKKASLFGLTIDSAFSQSLERKLDEGSSVRRDPSLGNATKVYAKYRFAKDQAVGIGSSHSYTFNEDDDGNYEGSWGNVSLGYDYNAVKGIPDLNVANYLLATRVILPTSVGAKKSQMIGGVALGFYPTWNVGQTPFSLMGNIDLAGKFFKEKERDVTANYGLALNYEFNKAWSAAIGGSYGTNLTKDEDRIGSSVSLTYVWSKLATTLALGDDFQYSEHSPDEMWNAFTNKQSTTLTLDFLLSL
jgi:hypothetical protein